MKPIYRYFVQPQVDGTTNTIFGYELLIRQLTSEGWRLPASFTTIDSQTIAELLVDTTRVLGLKVQYCSVNINRSQLIDAAFADAIIQSQKQLYPAKVVVELTEEKVHSCYQETGLIPYLQKFIEYGMQISLDDVGTGLNDFKNIHELLPMVSEIKFALQNFQAGIDDPNIQQKLHFWHAISKEYGLRMILEGIENPSYTQWSKKFNISLWQGYYYGKPELLRLPGDPIDLEF